MVATRGQRCRLASEGLQAALGRESGLQAVRVPSASAGVSGAALHLGSPHLFSFVVPAGKILPAAAKLKLKEAPVFPDLPLQPVLVASVAAVRSEVCTGSFLPPPAPGGP